MAKKIGRTSIIGQRGIAFIEQIVLEMGFVFYPTGGVEAGIDGFIELRDEGTGEVSNVILQIQGKATEKPLPGGSENGFDWPCDKKDIEYWLSGTAPVILFVVGLQEQRAYWKSIRDAFPNAEAVRRGKVHFDKRNDGFTLAAKAAIQDVALSARPGAMGLAIQKPEELLLNLVPIESMAKTIYWAPTAHDSNKTFGAALREIDPHAPDEWVVKAKSVISFHPLDQAPWRSLCDSGAMEPFDVEEWALSDDEDRKRDFVQLLNRALNAFVRDELWHDKDSGAFYFPPNKGRDRKAYNYRGLGRETGRNVVRLYRKKKSPTVPGFVRHSAFLPRFIRFEDQWYLEITPTYHFTSDGYKPDRYAGERLKKIKELENNESVLGQFVMWRHYLTNPPRGDLLRSHYPFLKFCKLTAFDLNRGVPDDLWAAQEPLQPIDDLFTEND